MSKTEYQPTAGGGWTAVVMIVCALAFFYVGPMVLLGAAGALAWRWIDSHHPLGKRHLVLLFAASWVPAYFASHAASGNALSAYLAVLQDVLRAAILRAV